ncbi:hypothetical protein WG902_10765 [Ramlibacter sp. PS3R-8]|uniref:hypothetical protein n=1 Tax=Ramlibacter sp. PS3R-8 TaxID=3133437 RepID=UPI0030B1F09E
MRGLLAAVLSAVLLLPAFAQEKKDAAPTAGKGKPNATLKVASEQMRLIFGGTAGKGVLTFEGKDHPFTFKSSSAGVGAKAVKKMSATGMVYGLKKIEDFAGVYGSVSTSTMAGTASVAATYKNEKGVTIDLKGAVEGIGLSLGGGIATVELIK